MPVNDNFDDFWKETADVPCAGCTVCCKNEDVVIRVEDGDILENYKTHGKIRYGETVQILDHQPNGDCVYLIENKCSIYEERPIVCRSYDCRIDFLSHTRSTKNKGFNPNFEEGKKRINTLDSRRRRAAIMIRKLRTGIT